MAWFHRERKLTLDVFISHVLKHRWLTILLSTLVILALAAGAARIVSVVVDVRNHFSANDPRIIELDRLENTYALTDSALIAMAPKEGTIFTPQVLTVLTELTDRLWFTPYVSRVDSIANHSHSEGREDELIVAPLVENPELLSESEIERIKEIALGTEEIAGRFVSRDGRVAGIAVTFVVQDDRQSGKVEVTDFLREAIFESRAAHPDMEFHLTGDIVLNRAMSDALNAEFSWLGPLALVTMLVVAVLVLGSVLGMVAIIIMLLAVLLSALGFTGWAGLKLYGESAAALIVLMAVTIAHSVHIIEAVLLGIRKGQDRQEAAFKAIKKNIWPVFLTSLTTAIGFLSLNFSDMPPFRIMGNIVAFGAMCAFVYSVTLLPAFLSLVPIQGWKPKTERRSFFDWLGEFVVHRRILLLWTTGVAVVVFVFGISRIELQENWLELLDENYEFRRSADFISDRYTGLETFEYSLSAGSEGGITDINYLQQVDDFAKWLREQPEIAHVFALPDIIKRLNMNLNGDDPEYYRLPDESDLAAQYLLLYEFSLPVGRDLNNLIDVARSETRLTAVLGSLTTLEKLELDRRAQNWLRDNAPSMESGATGVSVVGAHSIQRNIEKMLIGTITAMSIVSLLLVFVFKSVRLGLISLIPNFIPAAMAMGLWGYLVGDVGVSASVVTAIAFGIVVDDTIHFMTKYVESRRGGHSSAEAIQYAFSSVGRALFSTTAVFALGLLVFSMSGMTNNQDLGLLVGITVVFALFADFLFLPPLLMVLDKIVHADKGDGAAAGAESDAYPVNS